MVPSGSGSCSVALWEDYLRRPQRSYRTRRLRNRRRPSRQNPLRQPLQLLSVHHEHRKAHRFSKLHRQQVSPPAAMSSGVSHWILFDC